MSSLLISTLTHQSAKSATAATTAAPKKMSITQAYFLAHKARSKLSSEAARPDHNLRLLVGHANLLDSLMLDLAEAEREQESWFNQSVRGAAPASPTKPEDKHIRWADTAVEEPGHDWHAEDADSSDSDSDFSDEDEVDSDIEMADAVSLRRIPSHAVKDLGYLDDEEDGDQSDYSDDDEDFAELALRRSPSHSAAASSPPELDHDSDDTSDDESMPPSPPTVVLPAFSEKKQLAPPPQDKDAFYNQGYYLPPRNPARLVPAY